LDEDAGREKFTMAFISLGLRCCVGITAFAVLADVALAQAPMPQPDRAKLRQPTQSTVHQPEGSDANGDKSRGEADRKVRAMDRQLNRVLRSICIGC
jgi:hypothetical protein